MEALPITPAKASHQPVKPQVRHGFGDFFEVLLHEATLRLPARPTDLAAFQTRQASDGPGRRLTAAETIPAVEAEDRRLTALRADEPREDADGRGLARAVGSQETEDLTLLDGEVDAPERLDAPECFSYAA